MKPAAPEKPGHRYSLPSVGVAGLSLGIVGVFAALVSLRFDDHGVIAGPFARWRTGVSLVLESSLIAYFLTWLARLAAPRLGLVDVPGGRKCHVRTTPLMGGVAVIGTLLIGFFLLPVAGMGDGLLDRDLSWMLLSGVLLCLLGLWDDMKALRPRGKFAAQIVAMLPFVLAVSPPACLNVLGLHIPLGYLSIPVMVFWLVSCVNVINLIDGHDGLASSICAIAAFALAAIGAMLGTAPVTAFALLFAGSLLGFLVHNRPPARIFLGDAGSMPIGFFIGAIAVKASTVSGRSFALVPPLVILSCPFFDTFVAILRRKLAGRKIGEADRQHIHHRLQAHGLSPAGTLGAIIALCLTSAGVALAAVFLELEILALATCGLLYSAVIASKLFAYEEARLLMQSLTRALARVRQSAKTPDLAPLPPLLAMRSLNAQPRMPGEQQGDSGQQRAA